MADIKKGGWYRYKLLLGRNDGEYSVVINIQCNGRDGLKDFSRDEAEAAIRSMGRYLISGADFKTMIEEEY